LDGAFGEKIIKVGRKQADRQKNEQKIGNSEFLECLVSYKPIHGDSHADTSIAASCLISSI
jgi:hypothetical protein